MGTKNCFGTRFLCRGRTISKKSHRFQPNTCRYLWFGNNSITPPASFDFRHPFKARCKQNHVARRWPTWPAPGTEKNRQLHPKIYDPLRHFHFHVCTATTRRTRMFTCDKTDYNRGLLRTVELQDAVVPRLGRARYWLVVPTSREARFSARSALCIGAKSPRLLQNDVASELWPTKTPKDGRMRRSWGLVFYAYQIDCSIAFKQLNQKARRFQFRIDKKRDDTERNRYGALTTVLLLYCRPLKQKRMINNAMILNTRSSRRIHGHLTPHTLKQALEKYNLWKWNKSIQNCQIILQQVTFNQIYLNFK